MKKRKILLFLIDFFSYFLICSVILAKESNYNLKVLAIHVGIIAILATVSRTLLGIYRYVWRYARHGEYLRMILADFIAGGIYLGIDYFLIEKLLHIKKLAFSYSLSAIAVACLMTIAERYLYQYLRYSDRLFPARAQKNKNGKKNIAIIGAGTVGVALAEDLKANSSSKYIPYCFIDINNQKVGNNIGGIPVLSGNDNIIERIKTLPIEEIVIAIGRLEPEKRAEIFEYYKKTGLKVMIYDYPLENSGSERTLRDIKIEDLLFRDTVVLDNSGYRNFYDGKTVLVTGGGGSIGSELCRQVAAMGIEELIIFDIYENSAYELYQNLKRRFPYLKIDVEIASVRDSERTDAIIGYYRPDIIFHAAAHKHVPLMEHSAAEAIKNNVLGTYNVANAAEKYGVGKFVLISTDKAVNPTNVMGASKRVCEMIVQCRRDSDTDFAAVRFGNVLGSNGSVIPLFRSQIEAGGPVTITDKRIIRYFMTIPEAASLVMHTGVMAHKGELFVLDMGKPVKIIDLAEGMIELAGLKPYTDIKIKEVGLRHGEKLYEELLCKTEELDKTTHEKIFIEKDKPYSRADVDEKIRFLTDAVESCHGRVDSFDIIRRAMREVVPTYCDPEVVNAAAEQTEEVQMTLK